MLTQAQVQRLFNYEPSTGANQWKVRPSNRVKIGDVAGTTDRHGYVVVFIYGSQYKAHMVIWLYLYGVWPTTDVDHEDTDKSNNRKPNLRLGTRSQNIANSGKRRSNKTGYKGVHMFKRTGKFQAQITVSGKKLHLGFFDNPADASAAYQAAAVKHFGSFARI